IGSASRAECRTGTLRANPASGSGVGFRRPATARDPGVRPRFPRPSSGVRRRFRPPAPGVRARAPPRRLRRSPCLARSWAPPLAGGRATLGAMAPTRQVPRFIPQLASGRLLVALGAGLLVGLGLPGTLVALRIVAAWNAFAWVLLTLAWIFIWRADAAETRRHAAGEDPGRRTVWVVATLSSTFSLFAAVFVLRQAHRLAPDHAVL